MFTFIHAQTQYEAGQLFMSDKDCLSFSYQVQRALLNSLYEAKLLTDWEYEQCRRCLEEADDFGD